MGAAGVIDGGEGPGERRIRRLYEVSVARGVGFGERVSQMLAMGCEEFGLPLGILSRVEGEVYEVVRVARPEGVSLGAGDRFDLGRTYCCETLASSGPVSFVSARTMDRWRTHPAYEDFGLEAYIGTPVRCGGEVFGTLNFSSPEIREAAFTERDHDFIRLMGEWIGLEIERERTHGETRDARARLAGVLDSSVDGVMAFEAVRDGGGRIVDFRWTIVNCAAEGIVGRRGSELVGRRLLEEMPGNEVDGLFARYVGVVERREPMRLDHRYVHDGIDGWFRISAAPLGDGFVVSFADITGLKRTEETLRALAEHDPLTGLANRSVFMERLSREIEASRDGSGRAYAVMFFDFDRFKLVNDSLGHLAGDAILRSIAGRFEAALDEGALAARFGGDEFVVLSPLESVECASDLAERLLEEFARPHEIDGREIVLTASIGLATSEMGYEEPEALLRDVDAAVYESKARGRGRVVEVCAAMHQGCMRRLELEEGLRRAIERDEFRLVFQPIVELSTGHIVAAEALLRWRSERHGDVGPAEFIPIVEESGLIAEVGAWVLERACRELGAVRALGADEFRMTVNLSKGQLGLPGSEERLVSIVSTCGIPMSSVRLEVTESAITDDRFDLSSLDRLKARGLGLALDDFGTGTSSLAMLHGLPVDLLKIDRSFVKSADGSRELAAVLNSVVTLAQHLGMGVVAEGVETAEQVVLLQSLGCDYAQGFYFARPLETEAFRAFVVEGMRAAA